MRGFRSRATDLLVLRNAPTESRLAVLGAIHQFARVLVAVLARLAFDARAAKTQRTALDLTDYGRTRALMFIDTRSTRVV